MQAEHNPGRRPTTLHTKSANAVVVHGHCVYRTLFLTILHNHFAKVDVQVNTGYLATILRYSSYLESTYFRRLINLW